MAVFFLEFKSDLCRWELFEFLRKKAIFKQTTTEELDELLKNQSILML
jgi:hypothetical protein